MAYWAGLVSGAVENAFCDHPAGMSLVSVTFWRLRLNAWHFGSALFVPIGTTWLMQGEDRLDMFLLAVYFLAGALATVLALKRLRDRGAPRDERTTATLLIAIAWRFVRVSLGNP